MGLDQSHSLRQGLKKEEKTKRFRDVIDSQRHLYYWSKLSNETK